MKVTQQWLENRIKELNDWLFTNENHHNHLDIELTRNHYVRQLIELEENQQQTIKV